MCTVPETADDIDTLIGLLTDSLGTMAMVNYPYPTNFVNDMPAWPVDVSCKRATAIKPNSTRDYMAALAAAGNVFYNYTG